ncbi:MAG: hypothetical protein NC081_11875 [Roseburia sp.]|nr:hypothetical protein [Roseburia sp.]
MKDSSRKAQASGSKTEYIIVVFYFLLYLTAALSLVLKQPFGNPPDEYNRYLIPQYIARHGTLPNGYDEAIRIGGYGFSYAFQPILPYMIQGYCMRLISLFQPSDAALLLTARLVNLLFGLVMALFVLLLSRQWFRDKRLQYLFCFLVTLMPQSIFVHTYVNTDSCCMMSIAIMLYGLTLGIKEHFSYRSCILLSIGIIFCALSYYNAYGFILSSILLFTAYFIKARPTPASSAKGGSAYVVEWQSLLKKGGFISLLVLAGISWWFIRSALLYDGDILGLTARDKCAALYALPQFHPDTRITWESQGFSIWEMLVQSDFISLSTLSFIGIYGPMTIVTSIWIYRFYKLFFISGLLLSVLWPASFRTAGGKKAALSGEKHHRPVYRAFVHANMIFCILMPILLSIYYSYSTDYQPQGRYLLPMLIPFCYYCTRGFEKLFLSFCAKKPVRSSKILTGLSFILILLIILSLFVTIFGYAYPYYEANPIAP